MRELSARQLAQDRRGSALVQPCLDSGGPLGIRERVVERLQARPDHASLIAEQFPQPLAGGASDAPAAGDPPGLPAARAGAPETGVGAGAGPAERLGLGAAADPGHGPALRAACPPLLAGLTPWLPGRPGQVTGGAATADRAGHGLHWQACRAQRPARRPAADRPDAAAAGAGLEVGRVGDQAVRTQRPAVLIADRDLLDRPAPRARLETRSGNAVAAAPLAADPPVQVQYPAATRAGGMNDRLRAGVAKPVDQPQHRGHRRLRADPCEEGGPSSRTQASGCRCPARGTAARTAAATTSAPSDGSALAIISTIRPTGSLPAAGGHWEHRGCPSRSRLWTRRTCPQAAHGSRTGPQTPQYQSSPRRCKVRSCLPHPAQAGGGDGRRADVAQPISRSATARGAGDRPSVSTPGLSSRACARRRRLARPPAILVPPP